MFAPLLVRGPKGVTPTPAGQALMAREFSIDAMVEGNLAVYRELLDESEPRAAGWPWS